MRRVGREELNSGQLQLGKTVADSRKMLLLERAKWIDTPSSGSQAEGLN